MLRVLRHRDFGLLWIGQAVSLWATGSTWWRSPGSSTTSRTRPSALGLVGLAWTLPQVATLLLAGVLTRSLRAPPRADRSPTCSASSRSAAWAAGARRRGGALARGPAGGRVRRWGGAVPAGVHGDRAGGGAAGRDPPGERAKELMEPIGLRFAGPALGGLLIGLAGVGTALVIDAATFAASAVAVGLMSRQPRPVAAGTSIWRDLREGFAFVRARPWLWATLGSAALALLASFGPLEVLLPYLIRNDLGGGAATFGACSRREDSARSRRRCSSAASVPHAGT